MVKLVCGSKSKWYSCSSKVCTVKRKTLTGIVAHATIPISTGKLEGFNNVIKTAKRTAYGYLNNEFFLRLIRYLSLPKG